MAFGEKLDCERKIKLLFFTSNFPISRIRVGKLGCVVVVRRAEFVCVVLGSKSIKKDIGRAQTRTGISQWPILRITPL